MSPVSQSVSAQKPGMLSPYAYGQPISKDAVDAWSPSKAFAFTDRKTALHEGAIDSETSHTTTESGEEVLNDSFDTQNSSDHSGIADHAPTRHRDTDNDHEAAGGVSIKEADTSVDSAYTASFNGACYTTPPKTGRQKTSQARRKERDAKGEVSNDIFSVSWSHIRLS
jgi:hypothetical protein